MKNDIVAIDVSQDYIHHVDKLIERSKIEILEWFLEPSKTFKTKVYIYKDNEKLREGLRKRLNREYPSHMIACMVDEDVDNDIPRSINIYEPPIESNDTNSRKEYNDVIFHELVHYITDLLYGKLPEWLTEGIAKNLDGSYKKDLTGLMKLINTYEIPDIANMKDDNFVLQKEENNTETIIYDGYDFSYIMVRYIIETLGKDYLFTLMSNKEQINKIEQKTLLEAIDYFNCQYLEEKTIKITDL